MFFNKNPDELLKQATALEKQGEIDAAVKTLRQAYKIAAKTKPGYSVKTYLRLPLYLQKAGKAEEAWNEFNNLLKHGYPDQGDIKDLIMMDHSTIYDKMRLFLQREKRFTEAVKYGMFFYITWAIGLLLQKRRGELRSWISVSALKEECEVLLKKAKLAKQTKELSGVIRPYLTAIPNVDFDKLGKEIDQIVLSKANKLHE